MYEYYLPTALFIIKPFPVVTMPKFILDVLVAIIISDDGYFMTETITGKYFPDNTQNHIMILRESVLLTIHFHGAVPTSWRFPGHLRR